MSLTPPRLLEKNEVAATLAEEDEVAAPGPDQKIYVLYHADCRDGFGAAFAAWKRLGDRATYHPVAHHAPPPKMEDGATVHLLDFSYPPEILQPLCERMLLVLVIDHHASAQEGLEAIAGKDLARIIFDQSRSGAVLAWEHYHPGKPVPELLLYVQDRDLWQWKLPDSRALTAILDIYPMEFPTWDKWVEAWSDFKEDGWKQILIQEGQLCLRVIDRTVRDSVAHAWKMDLAGHLVPVANSPVWQSETCDGLLAAYPEAPFAACFTDGVSGRVWSLRSRSDFSVGDLAKSLGGGGHPQAAGFKQRMEFPPVPAVPVQEGTLDKEDLRSYNKGHYVADRIPSEAERSYEGPGGEVLRQATEVCLRSHRSVRPDQAREYAHFADYTRRTAGRNAIGKIVRPLEETALRAWAAEHGHMLDDAEFEARWLAGGSRGGEENQVYFDETKQRWYKRNTLAYHSTYLEFFYRLALHTALFPEAGLRLEGFVEHDGDLQPVISQPDVTATRGATPQEVQAHMKELGYVRIGGEETHDYYNPRTMVRIEDLHDENVLVGEDGELYMVDPVPYLDDRGKGDRLHQRTVDPDPTPAPEPTPAPAQTPPEEEPWYKTSFRPPTPTRT